MGTDIPWCHVHHYDICHRHGGLDESGLLRKLGLRDRVQAVIYAYETGLIAPGA